MFEKEFAFLLNSEDLARRLLADSASDFYWSDKEQSAVVKARHIHTKRVFLCLMDECEKQKG